MCVFLGRSQIEDKQWVWYRLKGNKNAAPKSILVLITTGRRFESFLSCACRLDTFCPPWWQWFGRNACTYTHVHRGGQQHCGALPDKLSTGCQGHWQWPRSGRQLGFFDSFSYNIMEGCMEGKIMTHHLGRRLDSFIPALSLHIAL